MSKNDREMNFLLLVFLVLSDFLVLGWCWFALSLKIFKASRLLRGVGSFLLVLFSFLGCWAYFCCNDHLMKWFVFMGEMGRRSLRPQSFSLVLFSTNKNKTKKKKKKKKTWILSV